MKPLSSDEIRSKFLSFFESRGHARVVSSPLVPENDPTLLFTNAGMVQFKDVFTGRETRPYTRAASSQKCVRAGGKHNDLENVGYTARHHTLFEMLGNFSFGDYFKKDAIQYAWDFVVGELGIPMERLAVTVFRGEDGIPADDEAAALWAAVGVPKDHIYRLGKSENYWQMGDTGPQGPCTEIHYYGPDDLSGAFEERKVERSEGWVEIWNLVFMQFNREVVGGPLVPLPKPSVDTGAGLERISAVLQGKKSNYETDLFLPIITAIAKDLGKSYRSSEAEDDVSMRVIADHARATAFLVADGVQPSNEGRGYVLRRIMRRAIRHGSRLGFDELFFFRACGWVIDRMKHVYPELEGSRSLIQKVAENEEASFRRTLDRGLRMIEKEMEAVKAKQEKQLDRLFVAKMYDTYGFPIDLTRVIANEHALVVDEDDAKRAVEELQAGSGEGALGSDKAVETVWFELEKTLGATTFTGYDAETLESEVIGLVHEGRSVSQVGPGVTAQVVLRATPFYAESGGQVGDRGVLVAGRAELRVIDTSKPRPSFHVHVVETGKGALEVGQTVVAKVDAGLRSATRKNHSGTHLLHLALREVLGDHVQQKGSLVGPDRLRFDFSHFEPLAAAQIEAIERRANEMVLEDALAQTDEVPIEAAKKAGAVMLFGEKYADRVRMIRLSDSLELCGGTHVSRTGEIGLIKIVSDSNVAAGIRRIEAVAGLNALRWAQEQSRWVKETTGIMGASAEELPERLRRLMRQNKELEKELERAKARAALGSQSGGDPVANAKTIAGVKVVFQKADGTPIKSLREAADVLRDKLGSGIVILSSAEGEKVGWLMAATKDVGGDMGGLVRDVSGSLGGSGGGRANFGQGVVPASSYEQLNVAVEAHLTKTLSKSG